MERREEGRWRGGGGGRLTLFTAMQLWSAFEPGGVWWQPLPLALSPHHSLYFSGEANSHSRSNFYGT